MKEFLKEDLREVFFNEIFTEEIENEEGIRLKVLIDEDKKILNNYSNAYNSKTLNLLVISLLTEDVEKYQVNEEMAWHFVGLEEYKNKFNLINLEKKNNLDGIVTAKIKWKQKI